MIEPSTICIHCLSRESHVARLNAELAELRPIARRSAAIRELARTVADLPVDHVEVVLDIARRFAEARR